MSGSARLSEQEKAEMLEDARSAERRAAFRAAFRAARQATQTGTLDDYIDFLSENMPFVPPKPPRGHMTKDFRL
jgi:hypothetical protein